MSSLISYAQNFEDVMLWRALKDVENGFYIDIGAQDPVIDSVSLAFHEHGWEGIHVEPTPHYARLLREQRPGDVVLEVAVGTRSNFISFFEIPDSGISTAKAEIAEQHRERGFNVREITVPCVELSSIFEICRDREIHWMKVDVEAFEFEVLKSWGRAKTKPWIVVVESTLPLTQIESHEEWETLLTKRGYLPVYFDGLNRYYLAIEKAGLKKAFDSPPNLFDGFVLTRNSWPWCTQLKLQILQAEQKLEAEKEASVVRHQTEEKEFKGLLEVYQAEAAHQLHESLTAKNELAARLNAVELEALNAFKVHSSDRNTLTAQLAHSQAYSISLAHQSAEREKEFSLRLEEKDEAARSEIMRLTADISRWRSLCESAQGQLNALRVIVEKDGLKHVDELTHLEQKAALVLALREQELGAITVGVQIELQSTKLLVSKLEIEVEALNVRNSMQTAESTQTLLNLQHANTFRLRKMQMQADAVRAALLKAQAEERLLSQRKFDADNIKVEELENQIRRISIEFSAREVRLRESIAQMEKSLQEAVAERNQVERQALAQQSADERSKMQLAYKLDLQIERSKFFQNDSSMAKSELQRIRSTALWRLFSFFQFRDGQFLQPFAQGGNNSYDVPQKSFEARSFGGANVYGAASVSEETTNQFSHSMPTKKTDAFVVNQIQNWSADLPDAKESADATTANVQIRNGDEFSDTQIFEESSTISRRANMENMSNLAPAGSIAELLSSGGATFVSSMYRTILGRAPDESGFTNYLAKLQNGEEKMKLIGALLGSAEIRAKRTLFAELNYAVDLKRRGGVSKMSLASDSSVKGIGSSISNDGLDLNAAPTTVEAFFTCGDITFINSIYPALLGRAPDVEGASLYLERMRNGTSRVEIITEIFASEECGRRQLLFSDLDAAVKLDELARTAPRNRGPWRVLESFADAPILGWFARVILALNRVSDVRHSYQPLARQELPSLVQKQLDLVPPIKQLCEEDLFRVAEKYFNTNFPQKLAESTQIRDLLNEIAALKTNVSVIETGHVLELKQKMKTVSERQHVLETQHLPNLLQTLSELNHRQLVSDNANDNLVKSVPIALRKITRDVNALAAQVSANQD